MRETTLGARLSRLRLNGGYGFVRAAQGIGITPRQLRQYEVGYEIPSAEILCTIADFYGVSVDAIRPPRTAAIAELVDDYALMMNAGDLGGVEIL